MIETPGQRIRKTIARLVLWLGLAALGHAQAGVIGTAALSPAQVVAGTSSAVTVTVSITDPNYLAGSANLQRLKPDGSVLSIVGTLRDDGLGGDAVAGDKIYTLRMTLTEPAAGPVRFQVSAGFKGELRRTLSNQVTLTVASTNATVPSTVGLTQAGASSAITAAKLTVGTVTPAFCNTVPVGSVNSQSPAGGTSVALGSAVNLVVCDPAAALTGLRVTPSNFTLVVNSLAGSAGVQLAVTGTLIDGSEVDLTSTQQQTSYSSSNLASCALGTPDGRVVGSQPGTCSITVRNNGRSVVVAGAVQGFSPGPRSFVAIPGYANSVAVSGDHAFVASGSTGLQVVALDAERRVPAIVASLNVGASANYITVVGNFAYLATAGGLKVVDIAAPTAPRLLGTFAGVGNALGVKVRGTTAYVTAGNSLFIVSVANPGAMIQSGQITLGGTAWNVELDPTRNLAAVAAGSAGLKLVDVSNLSAPVLRGTAATGDARGVALRGNTAIVADFANSMTAVNIANLAAPAVLSRTPQSQGGLLTNVVLSDNFAIGSDVLFVNSVPIVDVTNPAALSPRALLDFPARDGNGMDVAVDQTFIYLATDRVGFSRGGTFGDSRLYIGQYRSNVDLAGVPPTAAVTAPGTGSQLFEGMSLTMTVEAVDDVAVQSVRFLVGGSTVFTSTSAPYAYTFTVPSGVSSLTLGAVARDLGGNEGVAQPVTASVAPDPLTRVVGRVTDLGGTPLQGAVVTAPGGRSGVTRFDGMFDIAGVPAVQGNVVLQARYTSPTDALVYTGSSLPTTPVPAGVTDVSAFAVLDVRFETNLGTFWSTCDDCTTQRTLPFPFPFYGTAQTTAFVSTNGYVTFGSGDTTYTESIPAFSTRPRISAFFDDLTSGGGVWINDTLPDRYVITYDRVQQFTSGGSNTLQIQLLRDGRIVFAYKGVTSLTSGTMVGLTPGPNSPFLQVDFSNTPNIDVPAAMAVFEYFNSVSPFDLDGAFVAFTPKAAGGYVVRTILAPSVAPTSALTGATGARTPALGALTRTGASAVPSVTRAAPRALGSADIANAEVLVTSSGNASYLGMTNADAQGRFRLDRVPAGGISVLVRRNGSLVARGAGIFSGGHLNQAQLLHIELVAPDTEPKAGAAAGGPTRVRR